MTYQAGSAAVSITPDFRSFHSQVRKELEGLDAQFARAGDKAGASFGGAFSARLRASFASLPKATVNADADTTAAEAKLTALTKTRTAKIEVSQVLRKGGTLGLAEAAGAGAVALAPSALGLGAGLAGLGTAFGAAGAAAAGFGVIAKGMFSDVTDAQKKLTAAQQAYNKATTDKGRAKALAEEQKALAGLTPAEKGLARQLTSLQDAWKKLNRAEQPAVGAAIAPWLSTATSGMQLLDPLIQDGAGAVQLLGTEAKRALAAPFWGTFFNTLGTTGQISLVNFGEAAGKIGDGLAHIFTAFAPDIDKLPPLVNKLAGGFDKWARSVTSKGFDDFLAKTFTPGNLAALAKDGKSLGSLLTNIAKATGEMSPLAFAGLSNVLTILGRLTPGEIEALTGLFLAIKTIGTIGKGVSAVSGIISGAKGLLGKGAGAVGGTAEAAAAGTAQGSAAAAAFTTAFTSETSAGLAGAFAAVGAEGAGEAGAAGTAMGSAAAAAMTASFDAEGVAELGSSLAAGAAGAAVAAGLAGGAIGTALGLGFKLALGATGVGGAVGKIRDNVKSGAADSGTWLRPAGQRAGQGFVAGLDSEQAAARAAAAQLRASVTSGTAGSQSWIRPQGQQTGRGFSDGLNSMHADVNRTAARIRGWVTSALPAPESWLVNAGVSVMQGFANGIISMGGTVLSAARSIADSVIGTIESALHIRSPSKVTHQLGVFTGQGFGLGLASQDSFVGAQAGRLAVTSAQSLASLAAAQSAASLSALRVPSVAVPSLPGVGSPVRGGQLTLRLSYAGSGNAVVDALVEGLRADIGGKSGGDVQRHLGRP